MISNDITRITARRRLVTSAKIALAAGAIAAAGAGALALSPAAQADTIEQSCHNNPGAYAAGGVRGVYHEQRVGNDREEICQVYDANGKLLTEYTKPDYGYYNSPSPTITLTSPKPLPPFSNPPGHPPTTVPRHP